MERCCLKASAQQANYTLIPQRSTSKNLIFPFPILSNKSSTMIRFLPLIVLLIALSSCQGETTKSESKIENVILITTDGLRWQEVFAGMDSAIAVMPSFNEGDSAYIFREYWDADPAVRREKLMPFLWSLVKQNGTLLGNRWLNSQMDNANPYWFSYPGYSEILTGYADTAINSNDHPANEHVTVLEFLNNQEALKGKVAAFGAWHAFDRIINEQRSGIPVFNAMDSFGLDNPTEKEQLLNQMLRDSYKPWHDHECLDVFTHYGAMEYLKTRKPRVLYIAYGETDEWAHAGKYRSYLDAARQVDSWIKSIWEQVQQDPAYKDKTAILISTDHGRGDLVKSEWTSHGSQIAGASQIWLAAMGPGIPAKGEQSGGTPIWQQQLAQTLASLLGYRYEAKHPIAPAILLSDSTSAN